MSFLLTVLLVFAGHYSSDPLTQYWTTSSANGSPINAGMYVTPHCGVEFHFHPNNYTITLSLFCDDKSDWTEWNVL